MKKIMILIFSFGNIKEVINEVKKVINKDTKEIHLCFYHSKEAPETLSSLMGVYLGDKVQKDVENTILKEYFRMKETTTDKITNLIKDSDIKLKEKLFKNRSTKKIHKYIDKNNFDYLIINYLGNKFVSQKVFNNINKEFLDNINIKYRLIEKK
ncbi:MAG: hypothetical protein K9K32_04340 [Halanaerobiales bacterium]|nr:hypothetical protein [Halanaerobiales bacterium]